MLFTLQLQITNKYNTYRVKDKKIKEGNDLSRRIAWVQSSALAAFDVQRRKVEPPVTYTEGIPDKNTLRIHSVYVQGVLHKRLSHGEVRNQQPARPAGSKETPWLVKS